MLINTSWRLRDPIPKSGCRDPQASRIDAYDGVVTMHFHTQMAQETPMASQSSFICSKMLFSTIEMLKKELIIV